VKKVELTEFKKKLTQARESKKLVLGTDRTIKLLKSGKIKFVAFANNNPFKEDIKHYAELAGVETYPYPRDGLNLGELCKKPFSVSTLAVVK
jgi:large subunit ribosomal protein L30e